MGVTSAPPLVRTRFRSMRQWRSSSSSQLKDEGQVAKRAKKEDREDLIHSCFSDLGVLGVLAFKLISSFFVCAIVFQTNERSPRHDSRCTAHAGDHQQPRRAGEDAL